MTEDKYYKVLHNNKVFSVSSMGASPLLLQKLYFPGSFAPHAHMTSYNLLGMYQCKRLFMCAGECPFLKERAGNHKLLCCITLFSSV